MAARLRLLSSGRPAGWLAGRPASQPASQPADALFGAMLERPLRNCAHFGTRKPLACNGGRSRTVKVVVLVAASFGGCDTDNGAPISRPLEWRHQPRRAGQQPDSGDEPANGRPLADHLDASASRVRLCVCVCFVCLVCGVLKLHRWRRTRTSRGKFGRIELVNGFIGSLEGKRASGEKNRVECSEDARLVLVCSNVGANSFASLAAQGASHWQLARRR